MNRRDLSNKIILDLKRDMCWIMWVLDIVDKINYMKFVGYSRFLHLWKVLNTFMCIEEKGAFWLDFGRLESRKEAHIELNWSSQEKRVQEIKIGKGMFFTLESNTFIIHTLTWFWTFPFLSSKQIFDTLCLLSNPKNVTIYIYIYITLVKYEILFLCLNFCSF